MKSFKKFLPIALLLGFVLFGLEAFFQSRPTPKNARVYNSVQKYSPFYLDKRFGGLQIMNREDSEFKEKPTNITLFKEFERLERIWGQTHLKLENSNLLILDNNGSLQDTFIIKSKQELDFIRSYYGI